MPVKQRTKTRPELGNKWWFLHKRCMVCVNSTHTVWRRSAEVTDDVHWDNWLPLQHQTWCCPRWQLLLTEPTGPPTSSDVMLAEVIGLTIGWQRYHGLSLSHSLLLYHRSLDNLWQIAGRSRLLLISKGRFYALLLRSGKTFSQFERVRHWESFYFL